MPAAGVVHRVPRHENSGGGEAAGVEGPSVLETRGQGRDQGLPVIRGDPLSAVTELRSKLHHTLECDFPGHDALHLDDAAQVPVLLRLRWHGPDDVARLQLLGRMRPCVARRRDQRVDPAKLGGGQGNRDR